MTLSRNCNPEKVSKNKDSEYSGIKLHKTYFSIRTPNSFVVDAVMPEDNAPSFNMEDASKWILILRKFDLSEEVSQHIVFSILGGIGGALCTTAVTLRFWTI
jgi:hypothetical protein